MRKSNREVNGEKVFRYSIRKYHFGAASVAVAALMFFANGAVKANSLPVSPATANTEMVNAGVEGVPPEKSLEAGGNKEIVAPEPAKKTSNKEDGAGSNAQGANEIKVSDKDMIPANKTEEINKAETNGKEKEVITNKDKLESLLKEIDQLNLKDYTEDTVKVLQEKVAKAKEVLVNAKTQKEIDLAYNALVGYKNAGLKRVPKPKEKPTPKPKGKLTPKPDTTNGKETVGIRAENTEPNGTNIAGHNHSLNRTSLPEGSGFRATPEEVTGIEFGISNGQRDGNYSRTDRYFDTLSSNQYTRIFKFVSKSGNIKSVTATSSTGRSVTLEKMDRFPNNATTYFVKAKTDVKGVSDAILSFTVKTAGGDKTAQIGVYRSLGKPTIKVPTGQKESTVDEYLKGKQETKPTIDVEVPVVPNLPSYAKMKIYLVHDNDRDKGVYPEDEWAENHNPRPTRLTAKVDVPYGRVNPKTNKTTVTIQSGDYLKPLAEGKYFVLSVIEINNEMNTNPGIRASSFSDAAIVAPKEANKKALEAALSDDTTTKGTPAYYNAEASKKTAYDNAVASGKTIFNKANATQTEVDSAVSAITNAKNALGGRPTNKDALRTATSTGDTETKATAAYYNAEASKKDAYDRAVTAGKAVLARDNATQTEVNNALSAINTAKNALNGNYVSSTSSTVQPSHPVKNDSSAQASPSVPTSQATQPAGEGQPSTPVQASNTDTTVTPDEDSIRDKEPSTLSADQSRTDRSMEDVAKEESSVSVKQQLDKSELRTLSYELDERLKALTKVSDAKIDAAKTVLLDAKKAISDSDLTEQGLRDAVEAVKKALASLKDVKVNDVDSKTAQDKSDVKKVAEDSKDSDKMSETNSVPVGVFVAGLLALLGVIIFWLIGRKKESELKQLSIELTKILEQLDVAKADKKVLAKAQKLLQETLDFVKEESGSAETEAKLVEQLKAIITKLK